MYGYIYIVTNKSNGKRYIGQRNYNNETEELYLGSGKLIQTAIKKYGKKNFTKEIICEGKDKNELDELEKKLIKEYNAVEDEMFYNIASGGQGGNLGNVVNEKISKSVTGEKNGMFGKKMPKEAILKRNKTLQKRYGGSPYKGIERTKEDKQKIAEGTKRAMNNESLKKYLSDNSKQWWINVDESELEKINKKRSESLKKHYNSEKGKETKKRMSNDRLAEKNGFFGKKQEILKCPHCYKEGGAGGMQKWHFDNCRKKENVL